MQQEQQEQAVAQAKTWQAMVIMMGWFMNLPDEDGDKLPDLFDLCPEEVGSLENFGCENPQQDAQSDNDGDGAPNYMDQCPEVAGPFWGCPEEMSETDDDLDGLPNLIDACPDLPGPFENAGCPLIE